MIEISFAGLGHCMCITLCEQTSSEFPIKGEKEKRKVNAAHKMIFKANMIIDQSIIKNKPSHYLIQALSLAG